MTAIANIRVEDPYTVAGVLASLNKLKGLHGKSLFKQAAGQPGMIQFDSVGRHYSFTEITALKAEIDKVPGVVSGINQAVGGMSM